MAANGGLHQLIPGSEAAIDDEDDNEDEQDKFLSKNYDPERLKAFNVRLKSFRQSFIKFFEWGLTIRRGWRQENRWILVDNQSKKSFTVVHLRKQAASIKSNLSMSS